MIIYQQYFNAIKFTPDQGTIALTLEERESTIFITVADNGIGIPESVQATLFDKFTKARRPGIRGEKSVGLGMSIIKNIVELHDGRI
ncbi:sensor histidine kinase [Adhaeribacter pallidiroseus]|uniref:sensor histidine kinase n=1 Tax=Adhaeribacter pallidiroseus TaxID=2072847 RepID=UPI000E1B591F|nr:sensor histidine kinase [Adhaeribacter pallidiroseus]